MKRSYKVIGLKCANCSAKIEKKVNELAGVSAATVNFMTTKMVVEFDDAMEAEIIPAIEKIVFEVEDGATLKRC